MAKASFRDQQDQEFYHLDDIRDMPEFFMTLVGSSDQWMFLSSKGALTAGRSDPEQALFPYDTVDKVCNGRSHTGPKTMIRVSGETRIWEPFADWTPQLWQTRQGLARNRAGSRVIFDESNLDLGLEFSYSWAFSRRWGFVRRVCLRNIGNNPCQLEVLDGLLNLVNPGVTRQQITEFSCLIDAYKDNVIDPEAGLGLFSLSSLVTDRAEAAEALEASIVWTRGAGNAAISLDRTVFAEFAAGREFKAVHRACGKTSDFICRRNLSLAAGAEAVWYLVADRGYDAASVDKLAQELMAQGFDAAALLEQDIRAGEAKLHTMVAKADGLSLGSQRLQNWHHYSNVLFNIMRGGVPADFRKISTADAVSFIRVRNGAAAAIAEKLLAATPEMDYRNFLDLMAKSGQPDLVRLGTEYLPLTFSRRHGDPSRPWNLFSIKIEDKQGNPVLNHQGNWRDIFQNWEALGLSFPDFLPGFAASFLNATTLDGYNPYRVTRDGSDWEKLEPHNPWSNIGYWSDHQIIYLQKLLEWTHAYQPGRLEQELGVARYSYCAVPYRIASYADICRDPKSTISFDAEMDARIESRRSLEGNDARLVHDANGAVYHGSLLEKILTLFLAKFANLVPGGGIWMNTQRPEWNDANNALVGNGLSLVTLSHLRRFVVFWQKIISKLPDQSFSIAREVKDFMAGVQAVLAEHDACCAQEAGKRRAFMDAMGSISESYRQAVYRNFRFDGAPAAVTAREVQQLFGSALVQIDASLAALQRPDGLYHSYNILILEASKQGQAQALVKPLTLMLEGQVAILGAHYLNAAAAADLFSAIRKSALYRPDQDSYILYPERVLPDFRTKNRIDRQLALKNPLVARLLKEKDQSMLREGVDCLRFAPGISNHRALAKLLAELAKNQLWTELVASHGEGLHALYEAIFHHDEYTGRSGTMYAYEGIGSIYWHMVSKLLLAAQENLAETTESQPELKQRLATAYLDIRQGLGYRKSAEVYGAFPWEPYSHTPSGAGAKQPGMTGQVKEEILTRFAEYGLSVVDACLHFGPAPFMKEELCLVDGSMEIPAINGQAYQVAVPAGSFGCTVCGVPLIRNDQAVASLELIFHIGRKEKSGPVLNRELSDLIFSRSGQIREIRAN